MKPFWVAVALLALLPNAALACSMAMSPEFHLQAAEHAATKPPELGVRKVDFVAWLSDSSSCGGVGFINIELSGRSARDIEQYGVFIRVRSGSDDPTLFPAYPLSPSIRHKGRPVIHWAWTGITPDKDGRVHWQLEIVPVSRSGVRGTPISVCVASDESCARLAGNPPGADVRPSLKSLRGSAHPPISVAWSDR